MTENSSPGRPYVVVAILFAIVVFGSSGYLLSQGYVRGALTAIGSVVVSLTVLAAAWFWGPYGRKR